MQNRHETAVAVGVGAVIFNALFNSRIKDVDFSWDTALSFEGNTGPYVQYTYARSCSVLRKAGDNGEGELAFNDYVPNTDEIRLIKQLTLFGERVASAMKDYEPSVITRYLLECCWLFNQFYNTSPVLKADGQTKAFRIALTRAFREIAGRCLDLMGMTKTQEI